MKEFKLPLEKIILKSGTSGKIKLKRLESEKKQKGVKKVKKFEKKEDCVYSDIRNFFLKSTENNKIKRNLSCLNLKSEAGDYSNSQGNSIV